MVVTSDWHLGKVQDTIEIAGIPSRLYDTKCRLIEAVGYAKKMKESLIVAGDIFDNASPNPMVISAFFEILAEARKLGVKVFIIPGNHDCAVRYHSTEFMQYVDDGGSRHVTVMTNPTVQVVDGKRVLFLPHVPKMVVDTQSYQEWVISILEPEDTTKIDVVIGHAHLKGATNSSDVELEAGDAIAFNPSKFFKYKLGVFGHIHKYQVLGKNVYCGPVTTNSFDEAKLIKGFIHVTDTLEPVFVPYRTSELEYRELNIDLVNKDTVEYDPKRMTKLAGNKLLKLVVHARDMMQVDQTEIKKEFEKYGTVVRFEIVLCNKYSAGVTDDDIDDLFATVDYTGVFQSWVTDKKLDKVQQKLVLKLGRAVIAEVINASRT